MTIPGMLLKPIEIKKISKLLNQYISKIITKVYNFILQQFLFLEHLFSFLKI